ncbi:hypothetical protein ACFRSX_32705 [Streptomyces goshikiensis]|uniref:hypothetical protein n=1 Tax=Streptomyces TaxID=1883 RepID=UPI000C26DB8A|nr:hypothetical protein [Streptomyces sp. CB02120-2]PJN14543.1 hypothetical protein CG724_33155 [Streptomyces sp. CB02120-2]
MRGSPQNLILRCARPDPGGRTPHPERAAGAPLPTDSTAPSAQAAIALDLDPLRQIALGDTGDTAPALRAIHQRDETSPSLLGTLAALLDDIADRFDEHGLELETDALRDAAGIAGGHAGPLISLTIKAVTGTDS